MDHVGFEFGGLFLVWSKAKNDFLIPSSHNRYKIGPSVYSKGSFNYNVSLRTSAEDVQLWLKSKLFTQSQINKIMAKLKSCDLFNSTTRTTASVSSPSKRYTNPEDGGFIVVVQQGGSLRPSQSPVVHKTETAAKDEAKRLAEEHRGQEFYVLKIVSSALIPVAPQARIKSFN